MTRYIVAIVLFAYSTLSHAGSITATISTIGCHINSNQCFVYINAVIPNVASCTYNHSLRWDAEFNPNAKAVLDILLSAKATGNSVNFNQAGEVCYDGYTSFAAATVLSN